MIGLQRTTYFQGNRARILQFVWLCFGKLVHNCLTYPIECTVRQSNLIEHQSFDCRTQSNIIELTIKFCQSDTIERSITERLVIEPNRTFDYRTIGIIERSINETPHRMIGTWYWKIPKMKVKSPLTPFPFYAAFAEH